ncbi:MAG: HAMP domain-containing histidine kinase [Lachnospiraceae bacterium]|nr:HAMP domain-containing histidine kinase [Lachnospiraceae bacterium]
MMKGFKGFFVYLRIVLIVSLLLLVMVAGASRYAEIDGVMLNDITQTVKENWDNIDALNEERFDTDIMVFDCNNICIYSSSDTAFKGVNVPLDATREGMITMPVNEGEVFLGTVVLTNPARTTYHKTITKLVLFTIGMIVLLLVSYMAFSYYINRSIIKPFNRMKEFATLIARGQLDEPLIMDKDNIFGVFTESFDIMREELKAAKQREIDLKMKEKELVASLSHDLKTPVTGIRAICGVLSVKIEDEYLKAKVEKIEQKTRDINTLINDLLASALDDLGEMNVCITEETSDILNKIVEEYDIYGKASLSTVPECIVKIDTNRMSQVIGNIINNSYKYADTKIDISYGFNGSLLEMKIRDYGEGVDPEEVDYLTNKFYRGKKNTAGKEGSGLGLYISGELMKKMGGQLICISDKDGFEVTLMIPLA